jgi:DNA recombination protein RmuC
MTWLGPVVAMLVGLSLGAAAVWFAVRARVREGTEATKRANQLESESAALQERIRHLEQIKEKAEAQERLVEDLRRELNEFQVKQAALDAAFAEREKAFQEQKQLLDQELQRVLSDVSHKALERNTQRFLELAEENLSKRAQAIDSLVKPIHESLKGFNDQIREVEKAREGAYAGLQQQIKSMQETQTRLQQETSNLVRALGKSSQRGRWGEVQLQRAIEMAGMLEYCDFTQQVSTDTEDGRLRPDVIVHLPNDRKIVVDAKAPLDAYLRAVEATDDETRSKELLAHANQIKTHIQDLSKKAYWSQFTPTPELVVMFIPGEPIYGAALEKIPDLLDYGVQNKVLVATPVTLIGLLRAVAYGWQSEQLAKNAQKISEAGKQLYSRVVTFIEHLSGIGKGLTNAITAYDKAVASLDTRLIPGARKLKELGAGTDAEVSELSPLGRVAREPQFTAAPGELPPVEDSEQTLFP